MSKIAFYTCLSGKYDLLKDPLIHEGDWFCFTDQKIKSKIWKSLEIPKVSNDSTRQSRYCKLNPWELIPGYDRYIWQDACCQFKNMDIINEDVELGLFLHARIKYLKDEINLIKVLGKEEPFILDKQMEAYKDMPYDAPLFETPCFVVNKNQKEFFKLWQQEINKFSKRDQVSLCYLIWKENKKVDILPGNVYHNPYFLKQKHRTEKYNDIMFD